MKFFKRLKRVKAFPRMVFILLTLAYAISYLFFTHSIVSLVGIETLIRYAVLILLLFYFLFYVSKAYKRLIKRKYILFYLLSFITLILTLVFCFSSFFIDKLYSYVSDINDKDYINYTSYLISLKETSLDSIKTVGMIDNEDDIEGSILAHEIIKKNKLNYQIDKYDGYLSLLYALYQKKVDGIFVSSNYVTLFSGEEDFENIATETKKHYSFTKKMKNVDEYKSSNKELSEPFTVLIMGVDSKVDGLDANAAFNGDTLILATFNPHTLSATLFSIPRDTFVPIACRNNKMAKINSSAAYGTNCVISTIENLADITIDYYAKINFKGVVSLVDAVGGVEVDVQKPDYNINHGHDCKGMICEQNSDRDWGAGAIYLKPGVQTLNGEEALAYSRCRGLYRDSDLARNRHQQDIITALSKKMMKVRSYSEFNKILDAVSNNISTNMSTSQILSSYNILKSMISKVLNGEEFVRIQKTYLEVYNLPVYLPSSGNITSALGYYKDSLDDIIKVMKINLELGKSDRIKTFSFDANKEYTGYIAGSNLKNGASNSVLDNFIGKTYQQASAYCNNKGLTCSYESIDESSKYYNEEIASGLIAYQDPHSNTLIKDVTSVKFYIINK